MPVCTASCTPKRQNSVPTQVFTMRTPLVYAWPEGMPNSSHIFGRSLLRTPSKSILWLPVIFTIRTLYFSATSAMRRSSAGEVTPPHPGNHGKRAIALDIRMDPVVDEARRAVFFMAATPDDIHQVAESRFADLTTDAVAIDLQDFLHAFQLLRTDNFAKVFLGERHASAQQFFGFLLKIRRHRF